MMRVCFASSQAVVLTHGGVRTQMQQTKSALEALGVRVDLLKADEQLEPSDYDVIHIFTANIGTYHLARALRLHGCPLVISPIFYTRRSHATVRAVVAADRLINRVVRGVWTDYGLMAEMCGWASAVLPNTEEEAELFVQALGVARERVTAIPNGVEARFADGTAELFRTDKGLEGFILCVTHVGPERKNVRRLVEALEGIDHPAVIIGPVEQSPEGMKCVERAKRNPRLTFIEALPHSSPLLASAYAACDVFVLPSLFETPGIAAMEAALAGAKIVVTAYGGTREYFGGEAEYVNPASSGDIRRGILAALKKPKTGGLRERILQNFTWQRVAAQTKSVYESILR